MASKKSTTKKETKKSTTTRKKKSTGAAKDTSAKTKKARKTATKTSAAKKKTRSTGKRTGSAKTTAKIEQGKVKQTKAKAEPKAVKKGNKLQASKPAPKTKQAPKAKAAPVKTNAKPKKKSRTGAKVAAILAGLMIYSAVMIVCAFAVNRHIVKPDKFPDNTVVNGIDVSGLTVKKARSKLTKSWNGHSLDILDDQGVHMYTFNGFDFRYDIEDSLEEIMKPGAVTALRRFFTGEGSSSVISMDPYKNTKSFQNRFKELKIVKEAGGTKRSRNAYIDKTDTEFRIVKEVYGDSVDTKKLRKAIFNTIADGGNSFEYKRSEFYKTPDITSTSKAIKDEQEYCRKYLSFKIHYRNSVGEYTISPEWLDKMMRVKSNETSRLDKENINSFVTDILYPKFSTAGTTRRLKSMGGGRYTVSGGTYGYVVDVEKESKKLSRELKKRVDVERGPVYAGKTPKSGEKNDIGKDFVEISIGKQMVWVVRNGKVKVETPVVTGNTTDGHATPTGTYYIVYKQTNTTLRGRNNDGSEYESKVSYWAPFYLGYGLHDASWRGVFGGQIYRGNGSHGCVNCPVGVMGKIFNNLYEGMPVIVHS